MKTGVIPAESSQRANTTLNDYGKTYGYQSTEQQKEEPLLALARNRSPCQDET
jgi:hypothetical protein